MSENETQIQKIYNNSYNIILFSLKEYSITLM